MPKTMTLNDGVKVAAITLKMSTADWELFFSDAPGVSHSKITRLGKKIETFITPELFAEFSSTARLEAMLLQVFGVSVNDEGMRQSMGGHFVVNLAACYKALGDKKVAKIWQAINSIGCKSPKPLLTACANI